MKTRVAVMLTVPGMILAGLLAFPGAARAQGPGDGLYGRFDRPFTLAVGAGGGVVRAGGRTAAAAVGEVRLRHLDAAGPFLAGRFAPDGPNELVAGAEIRPLFPMLFLEDRFTGCELWDLLVQSLGFEIGAAFGPLTSHVGVGLALGAGVEVPVLLPSRWAQGLWLRLAFRYVLAPARWQSGPSAALGGWTAYATFAAKVGVGARMRRPR